MQGLPKILFRKKTNLTLIQYFNFDWEPVVHLEASSIPCCVSILLLLECQDSVFQKPPSCLAQCSANLLQGQTGHEVRWVTHCRHELTTKTLSSISPSFPPSLAEKLLSVVMDNPKDVFMVFCNTVSSCDWTSHFLKSQDIPAVRIHAGLYPSVSHSVMIQCTMYIHTSAKVHLIDR